MADCLVDLAVEYERMGQNQLGADLLQARDWNFAEALKQQVTVDRALEGLAALYSIQGDYPVALSYLERVRHVSGSSLGDKRAEAYFDSEVEAAFYMKLGRLLRRMMFSRVRGLQAAREVKDLRLQAWSPDRARAWRATTLRNCASPWTTSIEKISRIYEQLGDPDTLAWSLSMAARRYRQLHEAPQAVACAERAVEVSHQSVEPQYIAMTWLELGRAYSGVGRRGEAKHALLKSVEALESWRTGIAGGHSSGTNFFDERLTSYRELISMRAHDGEALGALEIAERLRARRLLDVIRQGKVDQDSPLSVQEKDREQGLAREAAHWNVALAKPTATAQDKASFEKAARDLETYRTELYTTHARLRDRRGASELITPAGIESLLPNSEALLVEYAFSGRETFLFTISRGEGNKPRVKSFKLDLSEEALSRRVEEFRKALATRDLSYPDHRTRVVSRFTRSHRGRSKGPDHCRNRTGRMFVEPAVSGIGGGRWKAFHRTCGRVLRAFAYRSPRNRAPVHVGAETERSGTEASTRRGGYI